VDPKSTGTRILVAIDLSERDTLAIARAIELALEAGAHIDLLHVATPLEAQQERDLVGAVEERAHAIRARGLQVTTHVASGDPADAIVDAAIRERPSRVVLAAPSHAPRYETWVGSVSRRVAEHVGCPVDIVRPERKPPS
jgi:nucleotide-binding universal stress UspA family protein